MPNKNRKEKYVLLESEFNSIADEIILDERFARTKEFIQHGSITTHDHAVDVARISFIIAKGLRLNSDLPSLIRGALLHDYFLYDWHNWEGSLHGFSHAEAARLNAKRDFEINPIEEGIIECHMWPLNITKIPRSKEAWIVCVADKLCSARETLFRR